MEQRGQKCPMIAQGHQRQPHCQEPVATPAQICLNQQDRMRQRQGWEQFLRTSYEPGKAALLVAEYLYALRCRAKDNNEVFWRSFAIKYFAPGAKSRICICNSRAVPLKDDRHCELCKDNLTNRLEVELLPSLFRIKYESGTLEELWVMDMPNEYQNSSGQTVVDYEKATLETVYENMRVVHEGHLRVVLTPDLKIFSWDFCVRQFEELVPKRLINTQLIQLEEAAQRYQSDTQNASSDLSAQVLQDSCNRFLSPVLELAKVMNPPIDRTFGFSKSSTRFHQVADVLAGKTMEKIMEMSNRPGTMRNVMESSKRPGASPIDSLKVYRAVSKLLSAKHASAPSHEGHDPPVYNSKLIPTVELPHRPGSTIPPSSPNNPPCISQQGSGSRPSSSYGAACGSNEPLLVSEEPLLETSSLAGKTTHCAPRGFGSPIQLQEPSSANTMGMWESQRSSPQIHEGGMTSKLFRGSSSGVGTSDTAFNVGATSTAPADENDLISGEREDRSNELSPLVDGYNTDDELSHFMVDRNSFV